MTNYMRTAAWLAACGKQPGDKKALSVQLGCHLEEIAELLEHITFDTAPEFRPAEPGVKSPAERAVTASWDAFEYLNRMAELLKTGQVHVRIMNRPEFLDAICDAEVTGNGLAFLAEMNKPLADMRVLDANDNKLVDGKPVILNGGKIGKGPNYQPPMLGDCV